MEITGEKWREDAFGRLFFCKEGRKGGRCLTGTDTNQKTPDESEVSGRRKYE